MGSDTTNAALEAQRREHAIRFSNWRTGYHVVHVDSLIAFYPGRAENSYRPVPADPLAPTLSFTLDDVIADVCQNHPGLDLTIWRDGRVVALIQADGKSEPRSTQFGQARQ